MISFILFYTGLAFLMLGLGMSINEKWFDRYLILFPFIIIVEGIIGEFDSNIPLFPSSYLASILVNCWEMLFASIGFFMGKRLRERKNE